MIRRPVRNEHPARCHECGAAPARVHLRDVTLCGVCWHRVQLLRAARP